LVLPNAVSQPMIGGHLQPGSTAITSRPLRTPKTLLALAAAVLAALALRLVLLAGPQTELEADEAIVGLMARHILQGERPLFYYMQPYMGSLEAYLVAAVFALMGSSSFALKLVPLVASLLFTGLVFETGRRIGGRGVALASALYVAVPPAFLGLWSLKTRGGYIEVLVIGQLLILLGMEAGKRRELDVKTGMALGFLSGLGVWVNPLLGVYLLPIWGYLVLVMRRRLLGVGLFVAVVAGVAGALPLIVFNLGNGLATAGAMAGGPSSPQEVAVRAVRLFRYSLPVLLGFSPASSSLTFFWPAFHSSPGAWAVVLPTMVVLACSLLVARWRGLMDLFQGRGEGADGRNLILLLVVAVPMAFVASRFGDLFSEPRYLLPLYSAVPLVFAGFSRLGGPGRRLLPLAAAGALCLNIYSLLSLDTRLNQPDTAVGSTAANRAALIDYLVANDRTHIYTDYWLAYPLAFESSEMVIPSVSSGGYNRYIPYAHYVSVVSNPAFVFVAGSKEEGEELSKWRERGVTARSERVGVYSVYWQAVPLEAARP